jgi:tRNA(fMet)-specific endonuclease VapC
MRYLLDINILSGTGRSTIGGNHLLIASQALMLGYTVVTNNEREFRRIDGLRVVNWLS